MLKIQGSSVFLCQTLLPNFSCLRVSCVQTRNELKRLAASNPPIGRSSPRRTPPGQATQLSGALWPPHAGSAHGGRAVNL